MFAEVRPNFGRIVTCCRAEHSAEFFGRTLASAELRPISISHLATAHTSDSCLMLDCAHIINFIIIIMFLYPW